jgi:uncharacterized NAD(P)/FAD-binding protein YdhS
MSALAEDPDHFVRWARCEPTDFLPRATYADYLTFVLEEAVGQAPKGSDVKHIAERVVDLDDAPAPWVATEVGHRMWFDAIVLATGNASPVIPPSIVSAAISSDRVINDPWAAGVLQAIQPDERVLIVGTGLTCVDVSLSILSSVPRVRVDAVSRHGLLPLAHEDPWRPRHEAPAWDVETTTLRDVIDFARSFGDDWRRGLDSLRPITNQLWQAMDEASRQSFVGRLSRFWDVHRHRMAPGVARAFTSLVRAGRVRIHASAVEAVRRDDHGLAVTLSDGTDLLVDRIVLCTGPGATTQADVLSRRMVESGIAQAGPMGDGYLVEAVTGALIDANGRTRKRLVTVGPPRRGVLWETTAMPEIRVQAAEVARTISSLPLIPLDAAAAVSQKELHDLALR